MAKKKQEMTGVASLGGANNSSMVTTADILPHTPRIEPNTSKKKKKSKKESYSRILTNLIGRGGIGVDTGSSTLAVVIGAFNQKKSIDKNIENASAMIDEYRAAGYNVHKLIGFWSDIDKDEFSEIDDNIEEVALMVTAQAGPTNLYKQVAIDTLFEFSVKMAKKYDQKRFVFKNPSSKKVDIVDNKGEVIKRIPVETIDSDESVMTMLKSEDEIKSKKLTFEWYTPVKVGYAAPDEYLDDFESDNGMLNESLIKEDHFDDDQLDEIIDFFSDKSGDEIIATLVKLYKDNDGENITIANTVANTLALLGKEFGLYGDEEVTDVFDTSLQDEIDEIEILDVDDDFIKEAKNKFLNSNIL